MPGREAWARRVEESDLVWRDLSLKIAARESPQDWPRRAMYGGGPIAMQRERWPEF